MKPIHKFNGGRGATLCHKCSVIISEGLTEDLYCEKCEQKQNLIDMMQDDERLGLYDKSKQTAVEWLLDNLISEPYSEEDFEHNKECWIKAEEMEKQQIIDAFWNGDNTDCLKEQNSKEFAEKYYNETYDRPTKN